MGMKIRTNKWPVWAESQSSYMYEQEGKVGWLLTGRVEVDRYYHIPSNAER